MKKKTDGSDTQRRDMDIKVSNIPKTMTENDLYSLFKTYGVVDMIFPRDENKLSSGHAFIKIGNDKKGSSAIAGLNGVEIDGNKLKVGIAPPRPKPKSKK